MRGLTKSIRNSDWDFLLKKQVHVEFLLLSMCGVYYSGELLTRHGHFLSRRKFLYLNNLLVVLYWNLGAESADRGVERRIAREQILSFWAPMWSEILHVFPVWAIFWIPYQLFYCCFLCFTVLFLKIGHSPAVSLQ